ncbi:hypothetical protein PR048_021387 [Dryococelus australis]|uniref:Uncharacterized protein n=1 Tax=Dryococelus australis TaxID=614101 RepID=A0ABQ9GY54_9NEOP|nr:hypothetical protein PR048_021387 [Dryococelus australis]
MEIKGRSPRSVHDTPTVQRPAQPGKSVAEKALQSLNKEALEKMRILFRNSHAFAKHGRPFTDFKWLCELDKKKACDNEGVNFCAPTRVGGTRWLSHTQRAVTGAIKLYPVLQKLAMKVINQVGEESNHFSVT